MFSFSDLRCDGGVNVEQNFTNYTMKLDVAIAPALEGFFHR